MGDVKRRRQDASFDSISPPEEQLIVRLGDKPGKLLSDPTLVPQEMRGSVRRPNGVIRRERPGGVFLAAVNRRGDEKVQINVEHTLQLPAVNPLVSRL